MPETTTTIRVEVGAGDESFSATEVAEILAGLQTAQRKIDGLGGIVERKTPSPMERLAKLLRDEVQALPVPEGCTGYYDDFALLTHDGDTCPVHELGDGEDD